MTTPAASTSSQAPYSQAPYAGCGGRGHRGGRSFGGGPGRRGGPPWARFFGEGEPPVPANIETTDASFVLTLFAAGRTRENFTLAVQNDVLTIAYRSPGETLAAAGVNYTRREFRDASFERAFQLNGKVLVDGISARYAEGLLTVTLPKDPATNQPAVGINVE